MHLIVHKAVEYNGYCIKLSGLSLASCMSSDNSPSSFCHSFLICKIWVDNDIYHQCFSWQLSALVQVNNLLYLVSILGAHSKHTITVSHYYCQNWKNIFYIFTSLWSFPIQFYCCLNLHLPYKCTWTLSHLLAIDYFYIGNNSLPLSIRPICPICHFFFFNWFVDIFPSLESGF